MKFKPIKIDIVYTNDETKKVAKEIYNDISENFKVQYQQKVSKDCKTTISPAFRVSMRKLLRHYGGIETNVLICPSKDLLTAQQMQELRKMVPGFVLVYNLNGDFYYG